MTDRPIPDSIMEEARLVCDRLDIPTWYKSNVSIIARALMAERERAARIVRDATTPRDVKGMKVWPFPVGEKLANAILSEEQP